jgi:PKD domain
VAGAEGRFTVVAAHSYATSGTFLIGITITDKDGHAVTASGSVTVGDVFDGKGANLTVATFHDASGGAPSSYSAAIEWGDGSSSAGTVSGVVGSVSVTGSHTYQQAGTYRVEVTITNPAGRSTAVQRNLSVVDAPLRVYASDREAVVGVATTTDTPVGVVVDGNPADPSTAHTSQVQWGDGNSSTAALQGSQGLFQVFGSHVYAQAGLYPLSVWVNSPALPFAVAMAGAEAQAGTDKPKVEILDAANKAVTKLAIGKWENAFAKNSSDPKKNFIDLDPDRFFIRVTDPAKKGKGTITVTLQTDGGGNKYSEQPTKIDLDEKPANSGIFESKSLLLVSNTADDEYKVDDIADNEKNDRTYLAVLGSTVTVKFENAAEQVRVLYRKAVNLHVVVFKDGNKVLMGEPFVDSNENLVHDQLEDFWDIDGDGKYTANLSQENASKAVAVELMAADEVYAQIGLILTYKLDFEQIPATLKSGVIDVSPKLPVSGFDSLTKDEQTLLKEPVFSKDKKDIEIYYVPFVRAQRATGTQYPRGYSFTGVNYLNMDPKQTPKANQTSLIAHHATYYTLAHEIFHVLSQSPHLEDPADIHNIFYLSTTEVAREERTKVGDTKRLTNEQQKLADTKGSDYMTPAP